MLLLLDRGDLLHQICTFGSAVSILCVSFLWPTQLLYLQFIRTLALHRLEIIGGLRDDKFPEARLVFDSLLVLCLCGGFVFNG